MGDCPEGADRFAFHVKRNQQALLARRRHGYEVGVTPFEAFEQQWAVAIEHIAARAEIARRTAADVRSPHAGDGGPVKSLAV